MVSLKTLNIKEYVKNNIESSMLLKCFYLFLFEMLDTLSEKEKIFIKQNKKDNKQIAIQGFTLMADKAILFEFTNNMEWLIGRSISEDDNIIHDNVSLLGIIMGANHIENLDFKNKVKVWINEVISIKREHFDQKQYADFFDDLLNNRSNEVSESTLNTELNIFNTFLSKKLPTNLNILSDYFFKMRVANPFDKNDDFFRSMINIYNEVMMEKSFILNQQKFKNEIELKVSQEKERIETHINSKIEKRVNDFAYSALFVYLIVAIILWILFAKYILEHDWNDLEPLTFIFTFGLLPYLINLAYLFVTKKELDFNPKRVLENISEWKRNRLYKEFFQHI